MPKRISSCNCHMTHDKASQKELRDVIQQEFTDPMSCPTLITYRMLMRPLPIIVMRERVIFSQGLVADTPELIMEAF